MDRQHCGATTHRIDMECGHQKNCRTQPPHTQHPNTGPLLGVSALAAAAVAAALASGSSVLSAQHGAASAPCPCHGWLQSPPQPALRRPAVSACAGRCCCCACGCCRGSCCQPCRASCCCCQCSQCCRWCVRGGCRTPSAASGRAAAGRRCSLCRCLQTRCQQHHGRLQAAAQCCGQQSTP